MAATALTYNEYADFLKELDIHEENLGVYNGTWFGNGPTITCVSPTTGKPIATIRGASAEDYTACTKKMKEASKEWQALPAPKRGEIIRALGDELRTKKDALGRLISLEMGKILPEALGEVQEYIDICDLAVGLSRTIGGPVLPSERADHLIMEVWNPLGMVGIITAFNFPMAVFGWNMTISLVCGNCEIWKGATTTSLCSLAITKVVQRVFDRYNVPHGVHCTISGDGRRIGEMLTQDKSLNLISFTGSTSIGRRISEAVNSRFGRTILELGGNNAVVVMDDANIQMALRSILFAAVGTCGQRCTTARRLLLHENIYDSFVESLKAAYKQIRIGDPMEQGTTMGPLHTANAVKEFEQGLKTIQEQGGKILMGGNVLKGQVKNKAGVVVEGNFVEPTLVATPADAPIVKEELFVPILHIIKFKTFEEAIELNNSVPQGLSSSLFSNNMRNVFVWAHSARGSDCGLVNVNLPTNGAEIGGAFGGEKETGAGRESGSDSWKQYMRRMTVTINYSTELPLAQGIKFE
eukprot:TRINITY_DN142_c0_g1_i1.p1 TRINITY_DN142_c0_g1~~TRINITY_DN142_c0_g1_i1.p1  ORF type:complete len:535 (+),score=185.68 TRINITY_DN142_c0_g1_i1:34-1605(+)